MKTDEQYYRALAHNTAPSIGGQLLRGYFSRMAEAEAERLRKDMTAVRARRTQIRLEYRAGAARVPPPRRMHRHPASSTHERIKR